MIHGAGKWIVVLFLFSVGGLSGCVSVETIQAWQTQMVQYRLNQIEQRPLTLVFWPDGDAPADLFALNADGTDPYQLTFTENFEWYPQWSPDGSQLAYFVDDWETRDAFNSREILVSLHVFSVESNSSRQLTEPFVVEDTRWINWLQQPLFIGNNLFVWSPDGEQIIYEKPDNQLYVVETRSGQETALNELLGNAFRSPMTPAYSPIGGQLAFAGATVDSEIADIYLWSQEHPLLNITESLTETVHMPAWSPDGTQLAFVGDQKVFISNTDGSTLQLVYQGEADELTLYQTPQWSPHGRYLFWGSFTAIGHTDLMLLDLTTGQVDKIAVDSPLVRPVWCTDSSCILYTDVSEFALYRLSLADFSVEQVNPSLPKVQNPVWRP